MNPFKVGDKVTFKYGHVGKKYTILNISGDVVRLDGYHEDSTEYHFDHFVIPTVCKHCGLPVVEKFANSSNPIKIWYHEVDKKLYRYCRYALKNAQSVGWETVPTSLQAEQGEFIELPLFDSKPVTQFCKHCGYPIKQQLHNKVWTHCDMIDEWYACQWAFREKVAEPGGTDRFSVSIPQTLTVSQEQTGRRKFRDE